MRDTWGVKKVCKTLRGHSGHFWTLQKGPRDPCSWSAGLQQKREIQFPEILEILVGRGQKGTAEGDDTLILLAIGLVQFAVRFLCTLGSLKSRKFMAL